MLSIGKLGAGQERYYTEKVAEGAEDYYSGEGEAEAEGQWIGQAATQFDLEGKVEPDQLTAMLTGRNPVTGEPLGLKSAPGREPVPGFDLTFSAPKSVSLTWALGGHPVSGQVMDAHRAAVEAALSYMERSACWARRGKGGATFVPGHGFLAAAYVHRSSRAGDPQLHTHVLVANATRGPDGRWSRLYHPAVYEHARTASYIYAAHLRHELTHRLGVEWESVVNGLADIRGFSTEELRAFSTRRAEILAAVGEDASAKAMRVAALETRRAKDRDLTDESMREGWRMRAEQIGLTREKIAGRLGHERPGASVLTTRQIERSVTEHVSHFDRRDAIRAVADNLPHGAPAHEVERLADEFLASDSVKRIAETPRGLRYTTDRIWELAPGAGRRGADARRRRRRRGRPDPRAPRPRRPPEPQGRPARDGRTAARRRPRPGGRGRRGRDRQDLRDVGGRLGLV
jgi:conjugative relaxase-like TrwC/TraI family protein